MNILLLAPISAILAVLFAIYKTITVLSKPEGTEKMKKISAAVREGANAYLLRQYSVVSIFFVFMFAILYLMALVGYISIFTPYAFLISGFLSALSGLFGMKIATNANARTCQGAIHSLNKGLRIAFDSGTVMGLTVVGLALLYLSLWYYFLDYCFTNGFIVEEITDQGVRLREITTIMITLGMGASFYALFARVGGGIYTKAADVGADLVGKVEKGIPEDDPRNPAVIADNVGDNVGDVAGMGADLFESYVGSIISSMVLGSAAFPLVTGLSVIGTTLPLIVAGIGIIAAILGTFVVRTKEQVEQKALLLALRRGVFLSAILIALSCFPLVWILLGPEHIGIYFAILSGLVAGIIIGVATEYFTSSRYKPTRFIATQAETGPATVIIAGLSNGMLSAGIPVLVVSISVFLSFILAGGLTDFDLGLYGVAISAVGMLSTLGITLATDAYGPVADNAGGIAEMSGQKPEVRKRTDALDALGNTTAATGKGFAIGSAALTTLALIVAYRDQVGMLIEKFAMDISPDFSLLNPKIIIGLFLGGVLPFIFSALTMRAVGRAASKIVIEVRRQFKEIKGLLTGRAKPEYGRCVSISTKAAQKEMILPSSIAILAPVIVGLIFGVETVTALLAGSMVSGFVLAIIMANSGGSWDNAKKYIEEGNLGGKGSFQHKATVVGDTVGDPFKDTSGPSINILLKLMSMVAIVFAAFILKNALFK